MTEQEFQAELVKRDEQIRALSSKLGANERIVKELGEAVERDAYGNPVRLLLTEEVPTPAPSAAPAAMNGNPWASISTYVPEFNPNTAETYLRDQVNALLAKQGYVTTQQANQLMQQAVGMMQGTAAVWRMYDRMTSQEPYKALADVTSPLYARTAKVLQERRLGMPLQTDPMTGEPLHGPVPFDKWQLRDLEALRFGADYASMELEKEAKAAQAATVTATTAQQAGHLSPTPTATGGGAAAPTGKPDFSTMQTPDEITAALSTAMEAEAAAGVSR